MKNRTSSSAALLLTILFIASSSVSLSSAYRNFTVGDSSGWFDTLERPGVDYQKWADSHSFSLGDFLIFNTDNNHSVVQTHNATVYALCDADDAALNDTYQWSSADPSATTPRPVTVPVPLTTEGPLFFFSGDYDGDQCRNGQRFKINVTHGQGLPDSLKDDDPAMAPANPDAGNDDSAPDTVVSSDFDHPREDGGDKDGGGEKHSSADGSVGPNLIRVVISGLPFLFIRFII
uniref:Phytocyanin domain-containing protein n=1 Tax=Kalanchoe fedtschenkoi TaxID=63787 RepID=A0A7N0UTI2_KALFE